uniref:Defensin-5 E21R-HD5, BETA-SHEET, ANTIMICROBIAL PEPTIDE n=1 Tax=Siphoviridae sp. ctBLh2 TaxID=2827803 RepID=A0A8S5S3U5_9CAUD|nr:MAG TPA: Defensin-5 E21R-HD5, BETA-SHEET, ANTIMICROBIAL PEPTIDE [Siphoviridae sp. ctBLh2]
MPPLAICRCRSGSCSSGPVRSPGCRLAGSSRPRSHPTSRPRPGGDSSAARGRSS